MLAARILGRQQPTAAAAILPGLQRLNGVMDVQTRNAATLKSLQIRMKSIANMKKITKAMKMVATAKFKKDQKALQGGMPFAQPIRDLLERLPREEKAGPVTFFGVTTDKGLCGGVNSAVNKQIRLGVQDEEAKGNNCKITVVGAKGVAGLKRLFGDRFAYSFEETSKARWTFATASIIAERIIASNPGRLKIVSNDFKSMAAYDTMVRHTVTYSEAMAMDKAEWSKAVDVYSFEPSVYEVWNDVHEWYYACAVYSAYLQSSVTETAQRMSAMENASKNAGEMYEKVSMQFNRARQAKITTELCEIISGAAAVSG